MYIKRANLHFIFTFFLSIFSTGYSPMFNCWKLFNYWKCLLMYSSHKDGWFCQLCERSKNYDLRNYVSEKLKCQIEFSTQGTFFVISEHFSPMNCRIINLKTYSKISRIVNTFGENKAWKQANQNWENSKVSNINGIWSSWRYIWIETLFEQFIIFLAEFLMINDDILFSSVLSLSIYESHMKKCRVLNFRRMDRPQTTA